MNEVKTSDQTWIEVISDFFLRKMWSDEEKYIKELIKDFEENCNKNEFYDNDVIKRYFVDGKLKKEKLESSVEFQRRRLMAIFVLKVDLLEPVRAEALAGLDREIYENKLKEICDKYDPAQWLSKASKAAASVSFATHVSKLTHSKIDSPSIFDQVGAKMAGYVTTSSLADKPIDGAVAGNQFAPIFQLLELECNGIKLAAELSNRDSEALSSYSKENEYLEWNKGFGKALVAGSPSSHFLAKQVYFPIESLGQPRQAQYHLLCNIKSSSMAQVIFDRLFSDEIKKNSRIFQEDKFSEYANRFFSKKGKIGVTASNHSNASQLNGSRGGKLYLFSTMPPIWNSQEKPPTAQVSFFDARLRHHVSKDDLDYLREFLIRFNRINMSIKNPEKKKWIDAWGGRIVDDVLAYAAFIQNMEAGWTASEGIKLKREHQLFLDPYCDDEVFQTARKSNAWQSTVCEDFARWLNRTLAGKDRQFSPQPEHTRMWLDLMEEALREYDELIRVDIKRERGAA